MAGTGRAGGTAATTPGNGIPAGATGKQALGRSADTVITNSQDAASSSASSSASARVPSAHLTHRAPASAALEAASYRKSAVSPLSRRSMSQVSLARARSLEALIAAASADAAPKVTPALPRGNYQQAVGVRHEYAGSKQTARGWVQNPIFVLLTAVTLCMVCAVESFTTAPSEPPAAFSATAAALTSLPPPRVLHVVGDDAWGQRRRGPLSGVRHWLARLRWPRRKREGVAPPPELERDGLPPTPELEREGLPPTPGLEGEGFPPTPGLEREGLPPTLPPGALCSDETKYQLIKLVLGASVAAVTLAVIYESHHEFGCVGQPWMRPPAIAA